MPFITNVQAVALHTGLRALHVGNLARTHETREDDDQQRPQHSCPGAGLGSTMWVEENVREARLCGVRVIGLE